MKHQIIKSNFDDSVLNTLLLKLGYLKSNVIIIDKETVKACIYTDKEYINNMFDFFKKSIYYESKQFYLNRDLNFKNIITIIRQLLKYKKKMFWTRIKYINSSYFIQYFIKHPLCNHI